MFGYSFFGVIIAVNITMATMASTTWTGLVVKNSYVASQKYNQQLEHAKALQDAGLRSDLSYYDGELIFSLKGKSGNRLNIKNLVADIGRPAFEQEDRKLSFLPGQNNSYKLAINLAPGEWIVSITGDYSDRIYRREAT